MDSSKAVDAAVPVTLPARVERVWLDAHIRTLETLLASAKAQRATVP